MTDIEKRLAEIRGREAKATEGPWAIEGCGEKGEGAYMIGVVFRADDEDAINQLSGVLPIWEGEDACVEIEYYREELIAECDFSNRDAGSNSYFIAHARMDIPFLLAQLEAARREVVDLRKELAQANTPCDDETEAAIDAAAARYFPYEFELWMGDEMVASACGPMDDAWGEAMHYVGQYNQDGPVRVFEVTRRLRMDTAVMNDQASQPQEGEK